nr:ATP synthase F0 subunit 8 [Fulicoffula longipila]
MPSSWILIYMMTFFMYMSLMTLVYFSNWEISKKDSISSSKMSSTVEDNNYLYAL